MTVEDRRYVREAFTFWVRSGFHDEEELTSEIEQRILDLIGQIDDPLVEEVSALVVAAFEEQRQREATWGEETANDRLDEAFAELWDSGIVALQDAGYTLAEGWEDAHEAKHDLEEPRGAVFYCQQDTEMAVDGKGLRLAFGSFEEGGAHERKSLQIASEVCDVLRKNGLEVRWDGTLAHRIEIPPFDWRKRLV